MLSPSNLFWKHKATDFGKRADLLHLFAFCFYAEDFKPLSIAASRHKEAQQAHQKWSRDPTGALALASVSPGTCVLDISNNQLGDTGNDPADIVQRRLKSQLTGLKHASDFRKALAARM